MGRLKVLGIGIMVLLNLVAYFVTGYWIWLAMTAVWCMLYSYVLINQTPPEKHVCLWCEGKGEYQFINLWFRCMWCKGTGETDKETHQYLEKMLKREVM